MNMELRANLRLQISMNNSVIMTILNSRYNLNKISLLLLFYVCYTMWKKFLASSGGKRPRDTI